MVSHPLLDALIQPSRPLPAHFRAAGVGMPKALPRLLQFGSVAPPQTGGSQFTGGRVSQPQTSLAHPEAAQGFTPPHFNPGNPTAPSLAPFVSTPQGGTPTGPPFSMGGTPTGATAPTAPSMQPPRPSTAPGAFGTALGQPSSPMDAVTASTHPPTQGGISTGGYTNTASTLAKGLLGSTPLQASPAGVARLLTAFAQMGQRPNPSAGNTRYFT